MRGAQQSHWLMPAYWHGEVFALARKGQASFFFVEIDADQIADVNLFCGQKIGEGINDVALDGAFQVTRSVALVRALRQ